jgi:hypothetical protein
MKNLSYKLKVNGGKKITAVLKICYKGKTLKWREQAESLENITGCDPLDTFESAVIRTYGKKKGNKIIEKICEDFNI